MLDHIHVQVAITGDIAELMFVILSVQNVMV